MKKIVPDPPAFYFRETAETSIGACDGHAPLFTVRPGISAEDALVHAALYLRCASDNGQQAMEYTAEPGRGFAWATQHSVQIAKALIDAVLDGIEARHLDTATHIQPQ
ncbi:DUF3077 domain-containing protein [Pseudomonas sp. LS1212]|uniref:DUF3077 domain-containing protein n=1 Tax=Pseudomonas sp. LS1212 TaxID=2972478 RepID=UPI00215CEF79|nr:DUF3077 domain-containing protein [Pseudomonas sp. LS1212]UVJ46282.1 DUF3077 domain-containing protein [Pseudomonas sp. LS1212]